MKSKVVYPFQGEHYKDIREEALEFMRANKENFDGIFLMSLFDETNILKDIIQSKKASKFYNLHLTQDPRLNQLTNSQKNNPGEDAKKSKKKKNKPVSEKESKKLLESQSIRDSYNYASRKMVYQMVTEFAPPIPFNEVTFKPNFSNDLNALMTLNKSMNRKTLFFSSGGGFFQVLEGVYFGAQAFEGGYPFEVTKKRQAIKLDVPKWALLLMTFLVEQKNSETEDTLIKIQEFLKANETITNSELFSKLVDANQKSSLSETMLAKRSLEDFQENLDKKDKKLVPKMAMVLDLLNNLDLQMNLPNECTLYSSF